MEEDSVGFAMIVALVSGAFKNRTIRSIQNRIGICCHNCVLGAPVSHTRDY